MEEGIKRHRVMDNVASSFYSKKVGLEIALDYIKELENWIKHRRQNAEACLDDYNQLELIRALEVEITILDWVLKGEPNGDFVSNV